MRRIIITGGDENFMPLLAGCIRSMRQWDFGPGTHIGCLDVGLAAAGRQWLASSGVIVAQARWDLPVPAALRLQKGHLRAMTARPFLPRYFPGYDAYVWIDADAWVQARYAIDLLFETCGRGAMAVAKQEHPAYKHPPSAQEWRTNRVEAYFGKGTPLHSPYLNTGVFALRGDAPHWDRWASWFRAGLEASAGRYVCDQTALNHMLRTDRLPALRMEALFNWTCHLALPAWDAKDACFREPAPPGRKIGIVHMTSTTKAVRLPGGRSLRFSEDRQAGPRGEHLQRPHTEE